MSFYLPPLVLLGPVFGAVLVYLFLRVQVWSRPEASSVASHGLWVGIIGWMASSLQAAMSTGVIRANPTATAAPATPDQIALALAWPVMAALTVHALGQWSYPAPKAPRRYAELTVRRIRDFLPRRLAWVSVGIFAYAALAIGWISPLPAYAPFPPPPAPGQDAGPNIGYSGYQDGRIAGWELAAWLGGALVVLAAGTWLVLLLIARRRQLETLDSEDNRVLRAIAANRLLRTVSTIAAGLAAIAGNFAALPAPGATWQSSWLNALGFINIAVLLVMWWWKVPALPSLEKMRRSVSGNSLRADSRTHGAAKLSISLGAALGVVGALPLLTLGLWFGYFSAQTQGTLGPAIVVSVTATLILLVIIGGELLIARNYGDPWAPLHWPRQAVSKGLLTFACASAVMFAVTMVLTGAGQAMLVGTPVWPACLLLTVGVGLAGAAAILAARRRRAIPEGEAERGLDVALRAITMYRIVRTLAAYLLAQAGMLLLVNVEAWGALFPAFDRLAPSPAPIGSVLLAVAIIAAVTPVRSLFRDIPRGEGAKQTQPAP
ncbi:hypothetical protein ACIPY2_00260 [Paenarthrobacter sp. NPDC089675]|uniref:hypothetical protein n=1 Tax=Paenarthrobacter sp. NPDC089675 TaxID=3364376 RepID=UPI003820F300